MRRQIDAGNLVQAHALASESVGGGCSRAERCPAETGFQVGDSTLMRLLRPALTVAPGQLHRAGTQNDTRRSDLQTIENHRRLSDGITLGTRIPGGAIIVTNDFVRKGGQHGQHPDRG